MNYWLEPLSVDEREGGEYELVIHALGRAEVKLQDDRVEVRRHIAMVRWRGSSD